MPDWNELNKEFDDAINSTSYEEFREIVLKGKTKRLIEKFYYILPNNGSFSGPNNVDERWDQARDCAIAAVEEIIDELECIQSLFDLPANYTEYWQLILERLKTNKNDRTRNE